MAMLKRLEKLTEVEEAILEASERLPAGDTKHAAYAVLRERGLPTRRVEAWHYTDLRNAIKNFPPLAESASQHVDSTLDLAEIIPAARIGFVNGARRDAASLPQGVSLSDHGARPGFRDHADAIGIINALTGSHGAALTVADGAQAGAVEFAHVVTAPLTVALRHAVTVGEGAMAVLLERHIGSPGIASHSNTVTSLDVADEADVTWAIVQEEGEDAVHMAQLNVTLGANAQLTILVLNAGGRLVRREINILARGAGSTIAIKGVNLIGGKAHVDVTTALVHESPGVGAQELFRNVATGEGRGVFQGQIRVAQIAQKTDAKMACNTLLLSDTAEFAAKPELEIFADDVACGHGATVTDILDEHMFYLRSRGIPPKQARAMLVQAFVEEVFDELEDETMREALDARIEDWLLVHG
jgi:Fe-S cluster assembly protein SufD